MRMRTKGVIAFGLMIVGLLFISDTYINKASAQSDDETAGRPTTTFSNTAAITINDAATASLYPSQITVSGLGGTIPVTAGSVKVTINGFSHSFPDDVGIVLVGPTGATLLLQDGAGANPDMVNVTYSLSDAGSSVLPDTTAWTAGTYKPTTYYTADPFRAST